MRLVMAILLRDKRVSFATLEALVDAGSSGAQCGWMLDDTPPYLRLIYEKWFNDHPGARAELATTTVRELTSARGKTYIKHDRTGEVQITKEEFDARYWARERGIRAGK
jgi:hypothetical protein